MYAVRCLLDLAKQPTEAIHSVSPSTGQLAKSNRHRTAYISHRTAAGSFNSFARFESGGTIGIDGQGGLSAFHKITDDGRGNRGQEHAIPIMSGGIVNAGDGAGSENRKSIRRGRPKARPHFQNRIAA